jgi:hypothetical protein
MGLAHKDVKNEDRTDYVHENTESNDKMADNKSGLLTQKCTVFAKMDVNPSVFLAENAQMR